MLHVNLKSFHMCLAASGEKPLVERSPVFYVFGKDMVGMKLAQFTIATLSPSTGSNTRVKCVVFKPDTLTYADLSGELTLVYNSYRATTESGFTSYVCRLGDMLRFQVIDVGSSTYPLGLTACAVFK